MDFQLLKPIQGWRAFVGEVTIVVLGVGIALVAEQIVEAQHWRRVVAEETEALDHEAKEIWGAMTARVAQQPCIDRRLADLGKVFEGYDNGEGVTLSQPIGRPRVWTTGKTALQIATADGALSHMPFERKQAYFDVYEAYDTYAPYAQEERASWRVLQRLKHVENLSAQDWRDLRNAYDDAVDSNVTMKLNLVIGDEGRWLTPFARFPRWPINRRVLELPSVKELCVASL